MNNTCNSISIRKQRLFSVLFQYRYISGSKPVCFLGLLLMVTLPLYAQTYQDKIGIGLGGLGGIQLEFVDVAKTLRPFEKLDGSGRAATDAQGWPTEDARTVFFDHRPHGAWWNSINQCPLCQEDPDSYQIDVSGTYKLSFTGQAAELRSGEDPGSFTVANKLYDPQTNTTMADIIVPKGRALMIVEFRGTAGGVKNVRLIRPGYHNRPNQLFRDEFLNAIKPYPVMRFMDWTSTNNSNPPFPGVTQWADRVQVTDIPLAAAPWEYIIDLANRTGKDIWINIPIAATEDYIRQLALLMKNTLTNPGVKIYLENSNEVWNPGFSQWTYNRAAAEAEVQAELGGGPASNLNNATAQCDPQDKNLWGGRRHVRRVKEIGDIFVETFSPGSREAFGTKIRPVFAWQIGGWVPYYSCILEWFEATYGAGSAKEHLYGLAAAAYVNDHGASSTATVDQILARMIQNSNAGRGSKREAPWAWWTGGGKTGLKEIADIYGLRMLQYETGPDNAAGWEATNAANKIRANRAPGMKDVLIHDLQTNWFEHPQIQGDLVMYFVLGSNYSRWGSWGATEDIGNLHSPKLKALYQLMGIEEDITKPVSVKKFKAEVSPTSALLTWTPSSADVTHYRVYNHTGAIATVYPSESLSCTINNLTSATRYTFWVSAFDAFNNESERVPVEVRTVPALLQLNPLCSDNPAGSRRWRVFSTFDKPMTFSWRLEGTALAGIQTVDAYGQLYFETPAQTSVVNTLTIIYETSRVVTREASSEVCTDGSSARLAAGQNLVEPALYPNPAKDQIVVRSPDAVKILISDMLSAPVREINLPQNSGETEISVADLPNGLYLVTLIDAKGVKQMKKLVISK